MATTKKKTSKKTPAKSKSDPVPTDAENMVTQPDPVGKGTPTPDFELADSAAQVAMCAWAGAMEVELPPSYLRGAAKHLVNDRADPHLIHRYWCTEHNAGLPLWHDLEFEQRCLAVVYCDAVVVAVKRQGFLTDVR